MSVHFSKQTRALDNAIMILNDGSSSLTDLTGTMKMLYDTGAITPFNADSEEKKGIPVGEIARWVYEVLNARASAEGSRPNNLAAIPLTRSR